MKSFIIALFLISCTAVVYCEDADDDNVPLVLSGLLAGLEKSIESGDKKKVTEYLKGGEVQLMELVHKSQNEKFRDVIKTVIPNVSELSQKLTSGDADLLDVNDFLDGVKERINQRLAERIREMAQTLS